MSTYSIYNYIKKYKRMNLFFIVIVINLILFNSLIVKANEQNEEFTGEVIQYAENFIGKPYRFGAEGPEAFDCSGLTKYVYKNFNIELPHYTETQWNCGMGICKNDLKEGDLVFFNSVGKLSHVGIYIGNNKFIHAASKGKSVIISSLDENYYRINYAGARRII